MTRKNVNVDDYKAQSRYEYECFNTMVPYRDLMAKCWSWSEFEFNPRRIVLIEGAYQKTIGEDRSFDWILTLNNDRPDDDRNGRFILWRCRPSRAANTMLVEFYRRCDRFWISKMAVPRGFVSFIPGIRKYIYLTQGAQNPISNPTIQQISTQSRRAVFPPDYLTIIAESESWQLEFAVGFCMVCRDYVWLLRNGRSSCGHMATCRKHGILADVNCCRLLNKPRQILAVDYLSEMPTFRAMKSLVTVARLKKLKKKGILRPGEAHRLLLDRVYTKEDTYEPDAWRDIDDRGD